MASLLIVDANLESTVPIRPTRVLYSNGCEATGDAETFVLCNTHEGGATILLDYGRVEGGYPLFALRCSDDVPVVNFAVTYSETRAGIDDNHGDGPFFLFSNAMDSYRHVEHHFRPNGQIQRFEARFAQSSQRYQKIQLQTPNCALAFSLVGFRPLRPAPAPVGNFKCSDDQLNRIWQAGVRTVDACTVVPKQTRPAWDFLQHGTRVYGQHWAPCRQGTRWQDKEVDFQVQIEHGGASWGVHMVANGLIFLLDLSRRSVRACEGLAHQSSVFPIKEHGEFPLPDTLRLDDWVDVKIRTNGKTVQLLIQSHPLCQIDDVDLHPLLGSAPNNSGSIALGGPMGWVAVYRNLIVKSASGTTLYENSMLEHEADRTMADFAVGSNPRACTIDGAKRDRSVFGGDLLVMGRSVAYSTGQFDAVKGSIELLASHQLSDGYLGNLCPIQAPLHDTRDEPPTYAFYSLEYALLLIVAIKDYWINSGDTALVQSLWDRLLRMTDFARKLKNDAGLVAAPPPLSMTYFPMNGPVFGPGAHINIAYYNALQAMAAMSMTRADPTDFTTEAGEVKSAISTHFCSVEDATIRNAVNGHKDATSQQNMGQAITAGILPPGATQHLIPDPQDIRSLRAFSEATSMMSSKLISPLASAFAAEALLSHGSASDAVELIRQVWSPMVDASSEDYSGCLWEALTVEGKVMHNDTSLSHGWSTAPVYLLAQYLAGMRTTSPGWKAWEVSPVDAGIDTVEYTLQTPHGTAGVALDWKQKHINVQVPSDTEMTLRMPKGYCVVPGEGLTQSQSAVRVQGPASRSISFVAV